MSSIFSEPEITLELINPVYTPLPKNAWRGNCDNSHRAKSKLILIAECSYNVVKLL